jgi:hypothetical protein
MGETKEYGVLPAALQGYYRQVEPPRREVHKEARADVIVRGDITEGTVCQR